MSPGFGLNDIFPAGPPDEEADPLLTDPLVNVHFTNGEIFSGKVTVYDLLLAIRSGFAPRPNSPLIDMADPRENSDPLVTDGRADIGAVELSSWPSERSRLTVLAEKVRHRWKDLEGDIGALINEYHEAPADRIRSDLAALLDGTRQVPASIRVWSDGQGIGQTRPFRTADAINWLLYMSEGARNKPALIQQAVRAYEKERGSWIGIALAHCGDPAAVDFLVNVLKARRDDANRKVQTLATGLKEGLGLIGRQHALKPLLAAAQAVDPSVSVRVARLLAHFGGEDAASAIVAMHGNKRFFRQKEGIARTLRYVNGADAAPVLGAVLKDKKANLILRMNAARGLGHIGGAAGAGALLNALARPHTGDELARVLGEALAAITEPPIATRLEGLYQANAKADGKVRSHIAFALAAQRQPRLTEQLCRIVADGKLADYARVRAAFTLGQLGSPAAVTSLGAVLRGESSPAAKCAAASALGRIADEAAIKALGEVILSTKDEKVANACANALGISGKQAAEDFLIKAIGETRSLLVRNTASLSLGRLGGERAASTLAKLLDSNDLTTRACAGEGLEAMAGSLNKEAIKVLSRVATSKDEKDYVKEAAALALAATGSPLARPALEKILTDAVGETIFMRKIASSGLLVKCGAGTPELRAKAVAIEDGRRANVGAWYVVGPFSLGGPEGRNETHPAETDTDFARSYTVGDKQLKWTDARRAHEEPYGFYTLRRMRGMYHESAFQADGLVYLATRLDVGSETHGAVFVEVDDGVRLWLNGELVIDEPLRHDRTARRIKRRVHFRKGTNDLRMKLPQLGGPWGFTVYLALPDGVKFRSIPIR